MAAKVVSAVVIFLVSCLLGIIPCFALKWYSSRAKSSSRLHMTISMLNCFSGGVFLGVSFLHVIPEAQEAMEEAVKELKWNVDYPFTTLLAGLGFIGVLLMETLAFTLCSPQSPQPEVSKDRSVHSNVNTKFAHRTGISNGAMQPIDNAGACENQQGSHNGFSNILYDTNDSMTTASGAGTAVSLKDSPQQRSCDPISIKEEPDHNNQSEVTHRTRSKLRGIILLMALSFHMIFDGLTVGLQSSDAEVWALLLPLCIHKALVFFNVGLTVFETLENVLKSVIIVVGLSLVSPVGIGIGIGMTEEGGLGQFVVSSVLQSVGGGTFLYVTFFEILQPELANKQQGNLAQSLFVALGFVLMAVAKWFVH